MSDTDTGFNNSAIQLSKNPLGIIALFIVLVYAMATLTIALPTNQLSASDKTLMVGFLVLFPIIVLAAFVYLVAVHTRSLYAPSDFADQKDWVALQVRNATVLAVATATASAAVPADPALAASPAAATPEATDSLVRRSTETVLKASRSQQSRAGKPAARLLWVDDHPANNLSLRTLFSNYGINVDLALSTDEALAMAGRTDYAVIISDMGRGDDREAGHTLLKQLREKGNKTPFVIHSTSANARREAETKKLGGVGNISDPTDLFSRVLSLVGS